MAQRLHIEIMHLEAGVVYMKLGTWILGYPLCSFPLVTYMVKNGDKPSKKKKV